MTDPRGSFRSHQDNGTDLRSQYCSWLITLTGTGIILLNFDEITVPSCDDTFLRIYDGSNDTARSIGTYCGLNATTEIKILSSTNKLYIVSNSGSYKKRSRKNNFSFRAQYVGGNFTGLLYGFVGSILKKWYIGQYGKSNIDSQGLLYYYNMHYTTTSKLLFTKKPL
jgi:hypothetical protein